MDDVKKEMQMRSRMYMMSEWFKDGDIENLTRMADVIKGEGETEPDSH